MTTRRSNAALAVAAVLATVSTLVGCELRSGSSAAPAAMPATTTTTSTTTSTTSTSTTTTTTEPPPTSTTTTTTTLAPPRGMVEAVHARLGDPRFEGNTVGLSVWVDGSGEILSAGGDTPMRPGSNEKLLVAAGALAVMGPDATLATEVSLADTHLHLVGGGDPSFGVDGLDALARQLRNAGVREVTGDLVADESRYDTERRAPGWTDRHMPTFVGPLSSLAVGRNWLRTDPEYTSDPALGNIRYFRQALSRAGIVVHGIDRTGTAPADATIMATHASPPISALVAEMLTRSDNFFAELLLKETGYQARGPGHGTTGSGAAAAHDAMAAIGVTLTGRSADGSGLSRDNSRPPGEWRRLLVASAEQAWGVHLFEGLPVAGRTGTLEFRFRGRPGEGNVRAKTGSVRESRALSGYLTTAGGRAVTFSLVVNGANASAAIGAMDDLVATMAASPT